MTSRSARGFTYEGEIVSDYWIGFCVGILSAITTLFVLSAIIFVAAARAAKSLDESQWRDSQ